MLRLPWVLLTLLIEMLAGVVIHYFDQTLGKVILLASFMPVIQAISGNTGLQSVTMVVRGLATGQVQLSRWWEPLWRQIQTSAILGAVCAVVVGLIGLLWHSLTFGFVVAPFPCSSRSISPGCAGTAFPMLSKRFGLRPRPDGRPVRDRLPGRPGRHDLPVPGDRPPPLAGLAGLSSSRPRPSRSLACLPAVIVYECTHTLLRTG